MSWERLGNVSAHRGGVLTYLGPSWVHLGASWGILELLGNILGHLWRILWGRLEASRAILGRLGASWEQPNSKKAPKPIFVGRPSQNPRFGFLLHNRNAFLKCLGGVLGTSRGIAGASWDIFGHLGFILAHHTT